VRNFNRRLHRTRFSRPIVSVDILKNRTNGTPTEVAP
jgi:hypothetical protein